MVGVSVTKILNYWFGKTCHASDLIIFNISLSISTIKQIKCNEMWAMLSYLFLKPPFIIETGKHRKLQTLEKRISMIVDGSHLVVFKGHRYPGMKTDSEMSLFNESEVAW